MKFRAVAVLAIVTFVFSCVSGDQKSGTPHYNMISIEDEWQLGAQLSADIAHRVQLVSDPQSLTYVREMGQRLVRQSRLQNLPFEFHIINSAEVNAFAAPGGHIYLTSGAIRQMHSASELAGLVGHIIRHAVDRHTTAALSKQYGTRELAKIANGSNTTAYNDILNQILADGPALHFTTADETIAEEFAPKWLQQAGYDPHGLVSLLQNLRAAQATNPSIQRFLANHPTGTDSLTRIESEIAKLPKKAGLITDEPEFHTAQSSLQK